MAEEQQAPPSAAAGASGASSSSGSSAAAGHAHNHHHSSSATSFGLNTKKWGKWASGLFKRQKPLGSEPWFNPERNIEEKREWLERQRVAQPGAAAWPEHIFENFFIVGLPPDMELTQVAEQLCEAELKGRHPAQHEQPEHHHHHEPEPSGREGHMQPPTPCYAPQLLFRFPAGSSAPISDDEVAQLAFPEGVVPEKLRRSPSLSSLDELIMGRDSDAQQQCFVFMLKVPGANFPLYGCCWYVREVLHRPPGLARATYASCRAPFRQVMIAAPRAYVLLSHYPFFELHFRVLKIVLDLERLERLLEYDAEKARLPQPCTPAASAAGAAHSCSASSRASRRSLPGHAAPPGAAGGGATGGSGNSGRAASAPGSAAAAAAAAAASAAAASKDRRQRYCAQCAGIIDEMCPFATAAAAAAPGQQQGQQQQQQQQQGGQLLANGHHEQQQQQQLGSSVPPDCCEVCGRDLAAAAVAAAAAAAAAASPAAASAAAGPLAIGALQEQPPAPGRPGKSAAASAEQAARFDAIAAAVSGFDAAGGGGALAGSSAGGAGASAGAAAVGEERWVNWQSVVAAFRGSTAALVPEEGQAAADGSSREGSMVQRMWEAWLPKGQDAAAAPDTQDGASRLPGAVSSLLRRAGSMQPASQLQAQLAGGQQPQQLRGAASAPLAAEAAAGSGGGVVEQQQSAAEQQLQQSDAAAAETETEQQQQADEVAAASGAALDGPMAAAAGAQAAAAGADGGRRCSSSGGGDSSSDGSQLAAVAGASGARHSDGSSFHSAAEEAAEEQAPAAAAAAAAAGTPQQPVVAGAARTAAAPHKQLLLQLGQHSLLGDTSGGEQQQQQQRPHTAPAAASQGGLQQQQRGRSHDERLVSAFTAIAAAAAPFSAATSPTPSPEGCRSPELPACEAAAGAGAGAPAAGARRTASCQLAQSAGGAGGAGSSSASLAHLHGLRSSGSAGDITIGGAIPSAQELRAGGSVGGTAGAVGALSRAASGRRSALFEQTAMRRSSDLSAELCSTLSHMAQADSASLLAAYRSSPVPAPGETYRLLLGDLYRLEFERVALQQQYVPPGRSRLAAEPFAYADAECAQQLELWTVAALCRCLSLDNILTLLNAALLEKQLVVFCPSVATLAALVLALVPLLRPFAWQSLLMPVTPRALLGFLDAPVPFVLGVQYKTQDVAARCGGLVRVNAYKDAIKHGPFPAMPNCASLGAALAPHHSALAAAAPLTAERPVHLLTPAEEDAARAFLAATHAFLCGLCGDVRLHTIVHVGAGGARTGVFMQDSLIESLPAKDRSFMRAFTDTQMFGAYADGVISDYCQG